MGVTCGYLSIGAKNLHRHFQSGETCALAMELLIIIHPSGTVMIKIQPCRPLTPGGLREPSSSERFCNEWVELRIHHLRNKTYDPVAMDVIILKTEKRFSPFGLGCLA